MRLVIAEKPSVAQSIAAVLGARSRHDGYLEGSGYIVSWCFGHLAELADAAVYNADDAKWTLAALPIIPTSFRFIVRSEKQKQFDILRELMRREDVAEVVNACDAGREGELIFRTVYLRDAPSRFCGFGFLQWRMMPSAAASSSLGLGATMTACINPPCAVPRPIGWLVSTPRGIFP